MDHPNSCHLTPTRLTRCNCSRITSLPHEPNCSSYPRALTVVHNKNFRSKQRIRTTTAKPQTEGPPHVTGTVLYTMANSQSIMYFTSGLALGTGRHGGPTYLRACSIAQLDRAGFQVDPLSPYPIESHDPTTRDPKAHNDAR